MSLVRKAVFSHTIKNDPEAEDAGTIRVNARIFGEEDNLTFTTTSFVEEFIDEDNDDCQSKQDVNYFLMEARLNNDVIWDAMMNLIFYVDEVTCSASSGYFQGCGLEVCMDFHPYDPADDFQIEEAVQASFNHNNNIWFRPASKFVMKSLTTKIYNKTSSSYSSSSSSSSMVGDDDKCTICLEEFNNETRVVTLPCGHEFDDECMRKWFETSHVCPLCRFELPCED